MVTIGSNGTSIHGPNAAFTLNSNLRGTAETWELSWSYKVLEEDVSNTSIPMQAASNFRGTFTCDVIATSDNDFLGLTTLTNGDLTVYTGTLAYKDISGTTKTTTFTARYNDLKQRQSKGEFVRYSVKATLNAVPTGY